MRHSTALMCTYRPEMCTVAACDTRFRVPGTVFPWDKIQGRRVEHAATALIVALSWEQVQNKCRTGAGGATRAAPRRAAAAARRFVLAKIVSLGWYKSNFPSSPSPFSLPPPSRRMRGKDRYERLQVVCRLSLTPRIYTSGRGWDIYIRGSSPRKRSALPRGLSGQFEPTMFDENSLVPDSAFAKLENAPPAISDSVTRL